MKELQTFRKYLTESKLLKENDFGGVKLTPPQLQKVEATLKKMYEKDYDEDEVVGYAVDLTLITLLNDEWEGKEITSHTLMNYSEEMAQSLGYIDLDDFEKYTDSIAYKIID